MGFKSVERLHKGYGVKLHLLFTENMYHTGKCIRRFGGI